MNEPKRSEKHEAARNTLSDELRPVFDDLVVDYKFAGTKYYGSPFVSYLILAELVRLGWRLGAEPLREEVAEHCDG